MTTEELEQVTREYILDIYKKQYIGKIKIQKLDPIGYSIHLGLHVPERPLVIYAELEDSKFLKFLRQELKTRRLDSVHYGELNLIYPSKNTECICQQKKN